MRSPIGASYVVTTVGTPAAATDSLVPSRELAPGRAHARGNLRIVQQMADAERRALDRVHGVTRDAVDDLLREPAREAADDGLAFPHRFRRPEPESALDGLVQHEGGGALNG